MSKPTTEEMVRCVECVFLSNPGYDASTDSFCTCTPSGNQRIGQAIRALIANRPKVSRELLYQWGNKLSLRQYNHPELMNEILPAMLREAGVEGEKEEEPKQYRCENCGKRFDKKLFSHSRTEESISGDNMVEVECGPITEIEDE